MVAVQDWVNGLQAVGARRVQADHRQEAHQLEEVVGRHRQGGALAIKALGDIARAQGITQLTRVSCLSQESF